MSLGEVHAIAGIFYYPRNTHEELRSSERFDDFVVVRRIRDLDVGARKQWRMVLAVGWIFKKARCSVETASGTDGLW